MEEKSKVKCEECKHYVDETDAQKVLKNYPRDLFYCPMHKKPYDKVVVSGFQEYWSFGTGCFFPDGKPDKYYKIIPTHDEEVNENGDPPSSPRGAEKAQEN